MKASVLAIALATAATAISAHAESPAAGGREYQGMPALMPVTATVLGAADGMRDAGWRNEAMEARVESVRGTVPTSVEDPGFNAIPVEMKENLAGVYDAARRDAAGGGWSEEALEGYLTVAESGSVPFMQTYMTVSNAFPQPGSAVTYPEMAAILKGSPAWSGDEYASAAMAQALAIDRLMSDFMDPAYRVRADLSDKDAGDLGVIGRWDQMFRTEIRGFSEDAGFYAPVEEVVENVRSAVEDAPAP